MGIAMWDVASDNFLGASSGSSAATAQGTAIWEFDGSTWNVKKIQSDNGGIAGDPPTVPGRFKGQLRATPCVRPAAV